MTNKTNKNYAGLTNEDILVIYTRFKEHLENMDKMLNEKEFLKNINIGKGAGAIVKIPLETEDVGKIRESQYYAVTRQIVQKLQPLAEMIQESEDVKVPTLNNI